MSAPAPAAPPPEQDGRASRLTPDEAGLAQQCKVGVETLVALPVRLDVDNRPGRFCEVLRGPNGDVFVIPFVVQVPAEMFEYGKLLDGKGQNVRGPTDGMLPFHTARIVFPRRNLTAKGWAALRASDASADAQDAAGWTLTPWVTNGDVELIAWVRPGESRMAGMLVSTRTDDAVVIGFRPDGEPVAQRRIVGEHAAPAIASEIRAWLVNELERWRALTAAPFLEARIPQEQRCRECDVIAPMGHGGAHVTLGPPA